MVSPVKKTPAAGKQKKKNLKLSAIIAGIALALLAVCFFTYRFLFPADAPSSAAASDVEPGTEETLANAIEELEAARKKTVKDLPITVYAGEQEISALYSGTLYDGVPYGTGDFEFSGPEWNWTFSGTLLNGQISTGKVKDYPFAFNLGDDDSFSKYTGSLVGGMPRGEGFFEVTSGEDVITLEGSYDSENSFTGTVTNFPLTFGYNGFVFEGRYTGELCSDLPEGDGQYSSEGENYYSYSGLWSGGSPSGPGELSTNCASFSSGDGSSYIAVYNGGIENGQFSGEGEMTIGDETSGGYSYSGTWKDGAFSGEGRLVCHDPSGRGYTYEGGFSAGAYNGEGRLIFDDENIIRYIGHFENGAFRPSVADLICAFSSTGSSSFELSEHVKDYISLHQEALLAHSSEDLNFGSGFSYDKYAADASNPDDRCFETSIRLVQKIEYPASSFGFPVAELIGYSGEGRYVYYGYYFGELPDVESDDIVRITAYPIGFSPYRDASGHEIPALRFAAFKVNG